MAKPKRPTTYKDWRALYHQHGMNLGWEVEQQFRRHGRLVMDQYTWKCIQRLRRIRERLDIESEVKDRTWCEALLELIKAETSDGE